MNKSNTERYRSFVARKKAQGLKSHKIWVDPEDWPALKEIIDAYTERRWLDLAGRNEMPDNNKGIINIEKIIKELLEVYVPAEMDAAFMRYSNNDPVKMRVYNDGFRRGAAQALIRLRIRLRGRQYRSLGDDLGS